MKNKFLRTLTFSFFCLSLFVAVSVCASAKTVKSGDFTFDVKGNYASLVEYTGSASTVNIPSKVSGATVNKVNDYAFWKNKKVVKVNFPATVTVIGEAVFNECTALTKVVLPEKLTTMGDAVFWYCTNLKYVLFGSGGKNFGKNIFVGCNKNLTLYVVKGTQAEKFALSLKNVRVGYRYISSLTAPSAVNLSPSGKYTLSVKISPDIVADRRIQYVSSNPKVASVSSSGVITALKCGTAVITCSALDGSRKVCKTTVNVIPAAPKITGQSNTTLKSYRLNWSKVNTATLYRVYRYNYSLKKWEKLADTTSTYLNVTKLNYNSSNLYSVRAYCRDGKNTYSGFLSQSFTAKVLSPGKATSLKRTASASTSVSFSWSPSVNTDGYLVYRYDSAKKAWINIADTKATNYTAKNLSPNTQYAFILRSYKYDGKVRVLSPNNSGAFYISTNPLSVTGLKVSEESVYTTKMTVSWNKSANINGYALFYAEQGGTETLLWLSSDKTSVELTQLKPGTTYKIRIQSYRNWNTGRLYSTSSTVTAATEYRPSNAEEAVMSFTDAFNNTVNSKKNCSVFFSSKVSASPDNADSEIAEKAAVAFIEQFDTSAQYNFKNGKDEKTGLSLGGLLLPNASSLTLTYSDVDGQSVVFGNDGNGYRVGFALENQTPETESGKLLAPQVDTEKIEEAASAEVKSVTYDRTLVAEKLTKIQGSVFDNLRTECTVTVLLSDGENEIPLTFEIERTFYFIWN